MSTRGGGVRRGAGSTWQSALDPARNQADWWLGWPAEARPPPFATPSTKEVPGSALPAGQAPGQSRRREGRGRGDAAVDAEELKRDDQVLTAKAIDEKARKKEGRDPAFPSSICCLLGLIALQTASQVPKVPNAKTNPGRFERGILLGCL